MNPPVISRRRGLSLWLGLFTACYSLNAAESRGGGKTNVVILLADDQGWGDLSANGNSNLHTPHIDSLGRNGVTLERFFVCPVCAPTRAEFLTGRYHPRGGVHGVSEGAERLDPTEKTIADTFRAAGYATGAFGKWHNGSQWPYHPNARGFEEFYGYTHGHWATYFDASLEHNGYPVQSQGYLCDVIADHAIGFIEKHQSKPFFCYVPLNTPHSPMQVPDRFYSKFANRELTMQATVAKAEQPEFTRAALAMCENIDWNVGRILQRLEDLHLAENTIVLYFSDNGPNSARWNGGMKGIKGSTDEGGVRSPFLIRWPGKLPAGAHVPQIAGAIDLLPTLADLAAVPLLKGNQLDGVSLKPLLFDAHAPWPERLIFSEWGGKVSVRSQRHRLDAQKQLFDLTEDPGQTVAVTDKFPDEATRLGGAVERWKTEVLGTKGKTEDRPYTVGYTDFPRTSLPARDGIPHGKVQRSAKAPNSSYFKNWTASEDKMTWEIEVATTGKYEAVVEYTCPAADLGSTIELSFNGSKVSALVSEANDPPESGAENDRVSRLGKESYAKDFHPMRFGVIELQAGRGQLTLQAPRVVGKQVMEVKEVTLTLVAPH
jgi:arylsulfatase A-like enzyme